MEHMVATLYPQHDWDHAKFSPATRTNIGGGKTYGPQLFLQRMIRSLFPEPTIIMSNVRSLPIVGSSTNVNLEVDIFLPDYMLGFEYQVPHHPLPSLEITVLIALSGGTTLFQHSLRLKYLAGISLSTIIHNAKKTTNS